jgi:hypothetical protein
MSQQPTISILPSFGDVLTISEKLSDQTLQVTTTNVENTQYVSVALTTNLVYNQQMANNSATITFPSADLQTLTNKTNYTITASVSNILGDTSQASYNFSLETTSPTGTGTTLGIRSDGLLVGTATTLNFSGSGISSVFVVDNIATIAVSGDYGEFEDT